MKTFQEFINEKASDTMSAEDFSKLVAEFEKNPSPQNWKKVEQAMRKVRVVQEDKESFDKQMEELKSKVIDD